MTDQAIETTQVAATSSPSPRRLRWPSAWHLVLIPLALVMVTPLAWMVMTSIQTPDEARHFPPVLPSGIHWQNYTEALAAAPFGRFFLNTSIVTGVSVLGNLILCSLAGYAFARFRFFGREVLFIAILATLMIPFQVVMIPTFLIMRHLGLIDTLGALILPNLVTPFGIFLMRQFFKTMPDDLMHAARLDGLGEFEILWRIMVPQALPAMLAFGVISIVTHWNDFFWPFIVIQSGDLATPPLGTLFFRNEEAGSDFGPLMAGTVVITAPLVLLFLAAQRRFIEGVTLSGMKG